MTTFRELAQRVDDLAAPAMDVDALVLRGEQRVRRRRVGAVVAAAAVVLVMILGGVFVGGGDPRTNGPIDLPGRQDKSPAPATPKDRQLVYADGVNGRSIHFGSRTVRTGIAYTHIDVTDDACTAAADMGRWRATAATVACGSATAVRRNRSGRTSARPRTGSPTRP